MSLCLQSSLDKAQFNIVNFSVFPKLAKNVFTKITINYYFRKIVKLWIFVPILAFTLIQKLVKVGLRYFLFERLK